MIGNKLNIISIAGDIFAPTLFQVISTHLALLAEYTGLLPAHRVLLTPPLWFSCVISTQCDLLVRWNYVAVINVALRFSRVPKCRYYINSVDIVA